jgi:hypothetical protein
MIYKNWPNDSRWDTSSTLDEHLADFYSNEAKVLYDDAKAKLKDA